jgi:hypothetical protein
MKKTLLTLTAVMVAAGAFAQGTVQFNNSTAGALTKVYMPDGFNSYVTSATKVDGRTGNTATDSVAGATVYTGALLSGAGFTAQLWSVNGSGGAESALLGWTTTTFRTGTAAGRLALTTATLGNVPADAAVATLQVRVFPTSYGTWAQALAAYNTGTDGLAWIGKSITFDTTLIGGLVNTPPAMTGLTSFSLGVNIVPEPSSMALAGLGAASLLIFRRRK